MTNEPSPVERCRRAGVFAAVFVAAVALTACGSSGGGAGTAGGAPGTGAGSAGATSACAPEPAGLVRWWTFDTGDGSERAQQTAMLPEAGAPTPIAGRVGGAASFAGASYTGVAPKVGVGDFSVLAWVRTSNAVDGIFVDTRADFGSPGWYSGLKDGRPMLNLRPGGDDNFFYAPNNYGTSSIADGQWHFVVWVADRDDRVTLFVDGRESVSIAPTDFPGVDLSGGPLTLGSENSGDDAPVQKSKSPYQGDLDELMIVTRAVTPAEITAIYEAGPLGVCKP